MKREKFEMYVKLKVDMGQYLALCAFFEKWNQLASLGSSRFVAFYVDGDGNFKPDVHVSHNHGRVEELTDEIKNAVMNVERVAGSETYYYDYDPAYVILRKNEEERQARIADDKKNGVELCRWCDERIHQEQLGISKVWIHSDREKAVGHFAEPYPKGDTPPGPAPFPRSKHFFRDQQG